MPAVKPRIPRMALASFAALAVGVVIAVILGP